MTDSDQPATVPIAARAAQRDGDIQAVARCAEILRLLAETDSVRPSAVATRLGLQRSTAHRYLASMAGADLVERQDDGSYAPGPLIVHLGGKAMRRARVIDVAEPYMVDLARAARETVTLSLWGGSGAVVVRVREDDTQLVHVSVREGSELPLFAAQSQLFLAHLPDRARVHALVEALPEHVRRDVEARLERVRVTGFGEHSMVVQGVHAASAPIFDSRGVICATLALVGTSDGIAAGPNSRLWRALREAADHISTSLGHVVSDRSDALD